MQYFRRLVIAALLGAALVMPVGLRQATADASGPIIPLSETDRAQLDRLLGKNIVGEALPGAPLAGIEPIFRPRTGS